MQNKSKNGSMAFSPKPTKSYIEVRTAAEKHKYPYTYGRFNRVTKIFFHGSLHSVLAAASQDEVADEVQKLNCKHARSLGFKIIG